MKVIGEFPVSVLTLGKQKCLLTVSRSKITDGCDKLRPYESITSFGGLKKKTNSGWFDHPKFKVTEVGENEQVESLKMKLERVCLGLPEMTAVMHLRGSMWEITKHQTKQNRGNVIYSSYVLGRHLALLPSILGLYPTIYQVYLPACLISTLIDSPMVSDWGMPQLFWDVAVAIWVIPGMALKWRTKRSGTKAGCAGWTWYASIQSMENHWFSVLFEKHNILVLSPPIYLIR